MKFVWEGFRSKALEWNVWAHFSGVATLTLLLVGWLKWVEVPTYYAILLGAIIVLLGSVVYDVKQGMKNIGYSPKDIMVNAASSYVTVRVLSLLVGGLHGRVCTFHTVIVVWLLVVNALFLWIIPKKVM